LGVDDVAMNAKKGVELLLCKEKYMALDDVKVTLIKVAGIRSGNIVQAIVEETSVSPDFLTLLSARVA
jgi:hypothetical protein